jgi:hypothetical protein
MATWGIYWGEPISYKNPSHSLIEDISNAHKSPVQYAFEKLIECTQKAGVDPLSGVSDSEGVDRVKKIRTSLPAAPSSKIRGKRKFLRQGTTRLSILVAVSTVFCSHRRYLVD